MLSPNRVVLNLSGYLNSALYSDVEVRCNDVTYKCHRIVLGSQIKFFDNACSLGFKEATEGVIDLSYDDPAAVKSMIQFAYTADYTNDSPDFGLNLLHHVEVYAIGHKYDIPDLQKLAKTRIKHQVEAFWKDDSIPDVIRAVYNSTAPNDRGLRDVMVEVVVAHYLSITEQDAGIPLRKVVADFGDFRSDCFAYMCKKYKTNDVALILEAQREERLHFREKGVLYVRHRLQKGFLLRDQAPKEEDMPLMSDYFKKLESFVDFEAEIIKKTKIHKVLKAIIKLNSIPREEEFHFKQRSSDILVSWASALSPTPVPDHARAT